MDRWVQIPLLGFEAFTNSATSSSDVEVETQFNDELITDTSKPQDQQMILPGFEYLFEEIVVTPSIVGVSVS